MPSFDIFNKQNFNIYIFNSNEVYTYSDQPSTCPECGNRTEIVLDLLFSKNKTQYHCCLSKKCRKMFVVETC